MRIGVWQYWAKDSVHDGTDLVGWTFIDVAEFNKTVVSDARDFPFYR